MSNLTRRNLLQLSTAGLAASLGATADLLAQDSVLKVGVVHQGPISDTGWESFHERAWRAMEAAFPGKVKATVLDNVLQAQDAERVFRQLAAQGHKLLMGTTFSQYATLRKLAPTLDVNCECCAGIAT